MARINEDGNIFGRLSALAVLVLAGAFVLRLQAGRCLFKEKSQTGSACFYTASEDPRDAVVDTVAEWRKR